MTEHTHTAILTVPPHHNPYNLYVTTEELIDEKDLVGRFPESEFTPAFALFVETFLADLGYVVVVPWNDEIEYRVARLTKISK
jgi:hypothetical protein